MKKAAVCLLCAVFALCAFCSCSKQESPALEIDGKSVSNGVFAYYVSKTLSSEKGGKTKKDNADEVIENAVSLCARDIAAENLMKKENVVFSRRQKSEKAEETENLWSLYSRFYSAIGTTKPDLTAICENSQRLDSLVEFYYGTGAKNEVSDDKLKEEFVKMYIGFKAFEGSFTKVNSKGETVEMTQSEKDKLTERFRSMAQKVDAGASIDSVYEAYCKSMGLVATSEIELTLIKDKDPMFADDFFKKVSTISHGRAAPVISGSSIYVVQRSTIAQNDDDAFRQHRDDVLLALKRPAVEKKIEKSAKKLKIKKDSSELKRIYETVIKAKK